MITPPPVSIINTVEQWAPRFWERFVSAVWAGYYHYGDPMQITDWWRSESANWSAGGLPDSQHLIGAALDLVPADPRLQQAMQFAGFIAVLEGDHVHIQAFPAGLARQVGLLAAVGV